MTPEYLDAAAWRAHQDSYSGLGYELVGEDGVRLASVVQRNRYCDRGHWRAYLMLPVPSLDDSDEWPRYFMRSDRAMDEVVDFLKWRLCGVRAEETPPTLLDMMTGEREVTLGNEDDGPGPAQAAGPAAEGGP